ncbi:MAG: hypothetical protein GY810_16260 [Aureispira sp.]|nr:hypothetical protein [Aureispira sp.]
MPHNVLDSLELMKQRSSIAQAKWSEYSFMLKIRAVGMLIFTGIIALLLQLYSTEELPGVLPEAVVGIIIFASILLPALTFFQSSVVRSMENFHEGVFILYFVGGIMSAFYTLVQSNILIPYLNSLGLSIHLSCLIICVLPLYLFCELVILILAFWDYNRSLRKANLSE